MNKISMEFEWRIEIDNTIVRSWPVVALNIVRSPWGELFFHPSERAPYIDEVYVYEFERFNRKFVPETFIKKIHPGHA